MMDPVAGITVFDGMATLAGVRPAGTPVRRGIAPVEPARRLSPEDHVDLSPQARNAMAAGRAAPRSDAVAPADDGIGRLVDVLA
jgi:hypothetical protein